jgi:hypothetical protein
MGETAFPKTLQGPVRSHIEFVIAHDDNIPVSPGNELSQYGLGAFDRGVSRMKNVTCERHCIGLYGIEQTYQSFQLGGVAKPAKMQISDLNQSDRFVQAVQRFVGDLEFIDYRALEPFAQAVARCAGGSGHPRDAGPPEKRASGNLADPALWQGVCYPSCGARGRSGFLEQWLGQDRGLLFAPGVISSQGVQQVSERMEPQ